tara:strand:- start:1064 stop:1384 length:321 start_codon:yes stop_codon:yes gene_type:complete
MLDKLRKFAEPRFVAACVLWAVYLYALFWFIPYVVDFQFWVSYTLFESPPSWVKTAVTVLLTTLYCVGTLMLIGYVLNRVSRGTFRRGAAFVIAVLVWIVFIDRPF